MPAFAIPSPTPTADASQSSITPAQVVGATSGLIVALAIVVGLTNWSIQRFRGQPPGAEEATNTKASDIEAQVIPNFEAGDDEDEAKLEIVVVPTLPAASGNPVKPNKYPRDIASTMALYEVDIPQFVSVADVLKAIDAHMALAEAWESSDDEDDELDISDAEHPPIDSATEPEVRNVDSEYSAQQHEDLPSLESQEAVVEETASPEPLPPAPAQDDSPPKPEALPASPVRRAAVPPTRRSPGYSSSRRSSVGPPRSPLAPRQLPNSPRTPPRASRPQPSPTRSHRSRTSSRLHPPSPGTSSPRTPVKAPSSPLRRPPPSPAPAHRRNATSNPVGPPSSQKYLPRPSTFKPTSRRPAPVGPFPSHQQRKGTPEKRATPGWRN